MSLFGKMDAANIPTNPYFIEEGEYTAEVTKALFKENRDGKRQLQIEYTLNGGSNGVETQFVDSRASQYFDLVDSDLDNQKMALLPVDEQKKIRRDLSTLKRNLCGNDNNPAQKGLGVDSDDLNDVNWNPASLIGTKVNIAISNYGPTKEGVNIKWVNLIQD